MIWERILEWWRRERARLRLLTVRASARVGT